MSGDVRLIPIAGVDLRFTDATWAFAEERRADIDRHWEALLQTKPWLWNGRVLLTLEAVIDDAAVLRATLAETDFASFVAWRDWGWPDRGVRNTFGSPIILSSDRALLYGRMGAGTANAGKVYPPGGSLEPGDVLPDGSVDVHGSIVRELAEETGLDAGHARRGELLAVFDGQRLSIAQVLQFEEAAAELAARAMRFIAAEEHPELEGVHVIRHSSDLDSEVPPYAVEIARYLLR
ncbi:MAG: NUDIX hydrolase [Hyphomicrobiales bacterium]